jgi:hypothetical protein
MRDEADGSVFTSNASRDRHPYLKNELPNVKPEEGDAK